MDYYKIGQKIRKYRKAKCISQEQLAEKVDISVTHLSHIETGNTKLSLPVLVDIANALGVHTDDLLVDGVTGRSIAISEISDILDSCTDQEIRIITDIIRSTKSALDKYNK